MKDLNEYLNRDWTEEENKGYKQEKREAIRSQGVFCSFAILRKNSPSESKIGGHMNCLSGGLSEMAEEKVLCTARALFKDCNAKVNGNK